ncbi:MAG: DUF4333 domain-containing protein [Myxococcota bacterium]
MMKHATLLCLLAAATLPGCKQKLDMQKIESRVEKMIEDQTEARVDKVRCPEKREVKKDDEFECDVDFKGGGEAEVQIEQDGEGGVEMKLEPIVVMRKLAGKIEDSLADKGLKGEVSCEGDDVRHAEEGDAFECDVATPEGKKVVVIDILDDDKWKWRIK